MIRQIFLLILLTAVGCTGDSTMDPGKPVVHRSLLPDHPTATEYFLPQPEMPDNVRSILSPWMKDIVEADESALKHIIEKRVSNIEHPDLLLLCDQLRSYNPTSVIIREDKKSWLRLDPENVSENIGSSVYIPPQPDVSRIQAQLDSTGFSSNSLFSTFAKNFCGLAEDFESAGNFLEDTEDWDTLSEEWQAEIIDNFDEWQDSLLIYHSRTGDQLLLHPDGHVGWWKFAEGFAAREFDSFSAFLRFYVKYRADSSWPLDSYGPPD